MKSRWTWVIINFHHKVILEMIGYYDIFREKQLGNVSIKSNSVYGNK